MDGQFPSIGLFSISNIQIILIRQINEKKKNKKPKQKPKNKEKKKISHRKIGSDEVGS